MGIIKKICILSVFLTFRAYSFDIADSIFELHSGGLNEDFKYKKIASSSLVTIKDKKFLLTNFHVCANDAIDATIIGDRLQFETENHKTKEKVSFFVKREEILFDNVEDICLIPVNRFKNFSNIKGLNLSPNGKSAKLTLASPFRTNTIKKNLRVFSKENPREAVLPKKDGYKINYPIELGMSGSPIVNENNDIVMIVWGRYDLGKDHVYGLTIGSESINKLADKVN